MVRHNDILLKFGFRVTKAVVRFCKCSGPFSIRRVTTLLLCFPLAPDHGSVAWKPKFNNADGSERLDCFGFYVRETNGWKSKKGKTKVTVTHPLNDEASKTGIYRSGRNCNWIVKFESIKVVAHQLLRYTCWLCRVLHLTLRWIERQIKRSKKEDPSSKINCRPNVVNRTLFTTNFKVEIVLVIVFRGVT